MREDSEPLFDDNTEESLPSPTSGSISKFTHVSTKWTQRLPTGESSPTFGVQLTRGPKGFGFSIAGGTDQKPLLPSTDPRFVYVALIAPGGVADLDGRLR